MLLYIFAVADGKRRFREGHKLCSPEVFLAQLHFGREPFAVPLHGSTSFFSLECTEGGSYWMFSCDCLTILQCVKVKYGVEGGYRVFTVGYNARTFMKHVVEGMYATA